LRVRKVPYKTTEQKCYTPSGLECYFASTNYCSCGVYEVTKYNNEFYTENVPVTRYKKVAKFYEYYSNIYDMNYLLLININFKFEKLGNRVTLSESFSKTDEYHNEEMPNIGLYKDPLELKEPLTWIKETIDTIYSQFNNSIETTWNQNFCNPTSKKRSIASIGNDVMKCLRTGNSNDFTRAWFYTMFGMAPNNVQRTFEIKNY
jgi:hypothetical protein